MHLPTLRTDRLITSSAENLEGIGALTYIGARTYRWHHHHDLIFTIMITDQTVYANCILCEFSTATDQTVHANCIL